MVGGRIEALDAFAASPLHCYAQSLGFCGNPLGIRITSWLYVQPDVQGVLRPSGTGHVPDALVLAAQLGVTL